MAVGDRSWIDEEEHALSQINITPLVDVAMVLLIIFMITAPMMMQGATVDLPRTQPMNRLPADAIYVTITAEGTYLLDEALVTLDELGERLSTRLALNPRIYVLGDANAPYRTVMNAMARIQNAAPEGIIPEVSLVVDPDPDLTR